MPARRKHFTEEARLAAIRLDKAKWRRAHAGYPVEYRSARLAADPAYLRKLAKQLAAWRAEHREHYNTQERSRQLAERAALGRNYVRRVLRQGGFGASLLTPELIETKRAIMEIHREARQWSKVS